jgi:ribosomal protection tetracycline resistance protein
LARKTLNLGILAHVDAGKTTLTERLLYAAGVIDEVGSVDRGTTQTDSLALEQQRGITIKSAVVSFAVDDVTVNLIDTPGHPDFIAEVERVLSVLDGAVLVVSAVEGVQPQTPLLMRALQRLAVPTLIFVNKMDRVGADEERVLEEIARRLSAAIVRAESPDVEVLAERSEPILAAYVEGTTLPAQVLRAELAAQTKEALVHPVFAGSALTGAGVERLMAGIAQLLPAAERDGDGPVAGTVFKIERGPAGERIAYVRMFSGTVSARERLSFGDDIEEKVTAIRVFDRGSDEQRASVSAGEIGKLWGLSEIRIGDRIGDLRTADPQFAPPTLESVVVPADLEEAARLRVALAQLEEQDPLIAVRQDGSELSVSLYGEVQKEVIQATLASDFGLEVTFEETTPICIERPAGTGEALEVLHAETNPYFATIGFRVEPAPDGSGFEFRMPVAKRAMPLYVYKSAENFTEHMREYIHDALDSGLFGWEVSDCVVTMTTCAYSVPDGPPSKRGPLSTAADFRKLTPLVMRKTLEAAGTVVCEPITSVTLEVPTAAVGAVLPALARLGGTFEAPTMDGEHSRIESVLSAARLNDLQRELPGLTSGEGVLESDFAGYRPVESEPPKRR